MKLKTAEKRAIIAEKMVKMFSKELDAREGVFFFFFSYLLHNQTFSFLRIYNRAFPLSDFLFREKEKYKYICDDMDSTFAELTGY